MTSGCLSSEEEGSVLIVSDLHMGDGGPHERFHSDDLIRPFIGGLDQLVGRPPEKIRLVLLGDLLDLSLVGRANRSQVASLSLRDALLIDRVDKVMAAHGGVFEELKAFIEHGGRVDVVPGNIDGALRVPGVWEHLCSRLLQDSQIHSQTRLRLYPWIFHIPEVLYAEHGNQYHEINSFPALLQGLGGDGPEQLETIGSLLEAHARRRRAMGAYFTKGPPRWMGTLAGQYMRASRVRETIGYASLLEEHAGEVLLPPALVTELDAMGSRAVWRSLLRALRRFRASAAKKRNLSSDGYLIDAALRIHRAARRHGSPVPFYVFGHAHIARIAEMEQETTLYVNCGAWATPLRGSPEQPSTPYVHVTLGKEPSCLLLKW